MRREPVTMETLRERTLETLRQYQAGMLAGQDPSPGILLVDAMDGENDALLLLDPALMGSERGKDYVSASVHQLIEKHGFTAAVSVFDTFDLRVENSQMGELRRLRALGFDNRRCAAAGVGVLTEALQATIETLAGANLRISWPYQRAKLNVGPVVSFGEIEEDADAQMGGRMKFFNSEAVSL